MTYFEGDSLIHRLDPRVKILVTLVFTVFMAVSESFPVMWSGLVLSVLLAWVAGLPGDAVMRRLFRLNAFMLFLWLVLPWSMAGGVVWRLGPLAVTREGIRLASAITLKGNAIVLAYTALLGTSELASIGHALAHLRVPVKLANLFLFTVRYVDVLHHEYERLVTAMRARCFRPRPTMHTYRSVGYLIAMLLTGSLDRSDRIVAAMKCRGFKGRFYVYHHFAMGRRDAMFGLTAVVVMALLLWLELA
jgi:cobalt/nickel transport system permease protein